MKPIPSHYSLVAEHPHSFEIHDKRDGKRFQVAKRALDLDMHGKLSKIKKYDDGGEVTATDSSGGKPAQPDSSDPKKKKLGQVIGYPGFADGGAINDPRGNAEATPDSPLGTDAAARQQPMPDTTQAGVASASPDALPSNPPQPGQAPAADDNIPSSQSAPAENSTQSALMAQPSSANAAIQEELGTLEKGSKAEQAAAESKAGAFQDYATKAQSDLVDLQKDTNSRNENGAQLLKEIQNNKIDPNRWWNSKTTGGQISAGLGMILGGLGAGAHGTNQASEYINQAIERDMDAQKNEQSKNMNLWKMNQDATNSNIEAKLHFQNQAYTAVLAQAQAYEQKAAGPAAAARLAPIKSQLLQQIAANNFHLSALSAAGSGQSLNVNPAMMLGSIPESQKAEAAKEIAKAQEVKQLQDAWQASYDDLHSRALGGTLSPADRDSAVNAVAFRIGKVGEGRVSPEMATKQAEALLPVGIESEKTSGLKKQRAASFFDGLIQAPVFEGATGIPIRSFASTSLRSAAQSQSKYKVGQTARDDKGNVLAWTGSRWAPHGR